MVVQFSPPSFDPFAGITENLRGETKAKQRLAELAQSGVLQSGLQGQKDTANMQRTLQELTGAFDRAKVGATPGVLSGIAALRQQGMGAPRVDTGEQANIGEFFKPDISDLIRPKVEGLPSAAFTGMLQPNVVQTTTDTGQETSNVRDPKTGLMKKKVVTGQEKLQTKGVGGAAAEQSNIVPDARIEALIMSDPALAATISRVIGIDPVRKVIVVETKDGKRKFIDPRKLGQR